MSCYPQSSNDGRPRERHRAARHFHHHHALANTVSLVRTKFGLSSNDMMQLSGVANHTADFSNGLHRRETLRSSKISGYSLWQQLTQELSLHWRQKERWTVFDRHREWGWYLQTKLGRTFETRPGSSGLGCEQFTNELLQPNVTDSGL